MKKIVVMGGGSGTYTTLAGLKNYMVELTAIVTAADSGGSTGILRDEFGILPPGDITRCLAALASDEKKSQILRKLFEYRFNGAQEKHKLGNLIMTALENITGTREAAVASASEVLSITGSVYPVTTDDVHLYARLENGEIIFGETNIDIPKHDPHLSISKVWLEPKCFSYRKSAEALLRADLIVMGPGDLYTSVVPNLLVSDIPEIIKRSSAKKVYVSNIMTKYGETHQFTLKNFAEVVQDYLGAKLDYVLANSRRPSSDIEETYAKENSFFVEPDLESSLETKIILDDMLSEARPDAKLLRHHPRKLARVLMGIL